eukprot:scaffold183538_cov35-Attheya_sp.AAC.1
MVCNDYRLPGSWAQRGANKTDYQVAGLGWVQELQTRRMASVCSTSSYFTLRRSSNLSTYWPPLNQNIIST